MRAFVSVPYAFMYGCICYCLELWSGSFQSYSFKSPASRRAEAQVKLKLKVPDCFEALKTEQLDRKGNLVSASCHTGSSERHGEQTVQVVERSSVNTSEVTDHTQKEARKFLAVLHGESMCPAGML